MDASPGAELDAWKESRRDSIPAEELGRLEEAEGPPKEGKND